LLGSVRGDPSKIKRRTAVNRNLRLARASTDEFVLPERVHEACEQLLGSAVEGLLALSVGVGLRVLPELMEEEVDGRSVRRASTT